MKTVALYWKKEKNQIRCQLCPHCCLLYKGQTGICKVRKNIAAKMVTLIYGEVTSIALDPIEKKPLHRFYPGSKILSIGTNGCNLSCKFCQNWEISQNADSIRKKITADQLIAMALETKSIGLAYTYNEPFIWYEFVLKTAKKAKKAGLKNVMVTNGFVNEEPLRKLLPFIDAMNIDIKSFKESFYRDICHGTLEPIKKTIKTVYGKCHLELTNLIIPSKNDTDEELCEMAEWVASISTEIPFHISRYFPGHDMNIPLTPLSTLEKAKKIFEKKLKYVYLGNI